jgi:hypothetical protein
MAQKSVKNPSPVPRPSSRNTQPSYSSRVKDVIESIIRVVVRHPGFISLPQVQGLGGQTVVQGQKCLLELFRARASFQRGLVHSYWPGISYRKDRGPTKIMMVIIQRTRADIRTIKTALPLVKR